MKKILLPLRNKPFLDVVRQKRRIWALARGGITAFEWCHEEREMRLTLYTDYSLRVLIYLSGREDEIVTVTELADFYKISRNHLTKVVHNLGLDGYILTTRGRHGGLKLARSPNEILVGDVVRSTEPDFDLLECFNPTTDKCVISSSCSLKSVIYNAQVGFLDVLDKYTIADIARETRKTNPLFKSIPIVLK